MAHQYADIAFTPTVKALQEQMGSRKAYAHREQGEEIENRSLSEAEAQFIEARDSFYLASVSETGWPYLQHRGGPRGFVKVLGETSIGFADFSGNRQYVSLGNTQNDDRVSLFFMDYANRARLKMYGRLRVIEPEQTGLLNRLAVPGYKARIERGILITVEAFDWNCPQHITPRFTQDEVTTAVAPLHDRIAELEAQLAVYAAQPNI